MDNDSWYSVIEYCDLEQWKSILAVSKEHEQLVMLQTSKLPLYVFYDLVKIQSGRLADYFLKTQETKLNEQELGNLKTALFWDFITCKSDSFFLHVAKKIFPQFELDCESICIKILKVRRIVLLLNHGLIKYTQKISKLLLDGYGTDTIYNTGLDNVKKWLSGGWGRKCKGDSVRKILATPENQTKVLRSNIKMIDYFVEKCPEYIEIEPQKSWEHVLKIKLYRKFFGDWELQKDNFNAILLAIMDGNVKSIKNDPGCYSTKYCDMHFEIYIFQKMRKNKIQVVHRTIVLSKISDEKTIFSIFVCALKLEDFNIARTILRLFPGVIDQCDLGIDKIITDFLASNPYEFQLIDLSYKRVCITSDDDMKLFSSHADLNLEKRFWDFGIDGGVQFDIFLNNLKQCGIEKMLDKNVFDLDNTLKNGEWLENCESIFFDNFHELVFHSRTKTNNEKMLPVYAELLSNPKFLEKRDPLRLIYETMYLDCVDCFDKVYEHCKFAFFRLYENKDNFIIFLQRCSLKLLKRIMNLVPEFFNIEIRQEYVRATQYEYSNKFYFMYKDTLKTNQVALNTKKKKCMYNHTFTSDLSLRPDDCEEFAMLHGFDLEEFLKYQIESLVTEFDADYSVPLHAEILESILFLYLEKFGDFEMKSHFRIGKSMLKFMGKYSNENELAKHILGKNWKYALFSVKSDNDEKKKISMRIVSM